MRCEKVFEEIYRKEPEGISFCPYRVCPLGAHTDHNLGKVTGFALDKGINIAYRPKMNGVVELCSMQFEKRAQWHVLSTPKIRQMDWADYLRGVTIELSKKYPISVGVSGVIEGSLPIGGLSSSAALCISFLNALCKVNGIHLEPEEIISIAYNAENSYMGVGCGRLDQSCEVYCRKDCLLHLDCQNGQYELLPRAAGMKDFDILIFFSGLERNLASSAFNMRVDEARSAAYALKAYSGMDYGKFEETNLREVPVEVFRRYAGQLPLNWMKRAEHWYSESSRVEAGVEAWKKGDIEEYGRLIFESGKSSICNWETGSDELKCLYDIMTRTEGIYGGRFSGAGFKGCSMALVDPAYTEQVRETVRKEYLAAFPQYSETYMSAVCHSSDGVVI